MSIDVLVTTHYFNKLLPPSSRILYISEGESEYAPYLMEQGHEVTVFNSLEKYASGEYAIDLSAFKMESFDAVLCLGALHNLFYLVEREGCVAECLSVLKSGGIFVFSYINRDATHITKSVKGTAALDDLVDAMKTDRLGMFYAMEAGEAQTLMGKFPITKIANIGIDKLDQALQRKLGIATSKELADYMENYLATCEQQSVVEHSSHVLWFGKKN
ncbi:MAG: class I SAM-dependent methyltransferase [Defluviitaleaceae bacterium]|nr:class I SAM-dependent methyltransferase [Defluviitaleaceae bacterium]